MKKETFYIYIISNKKYGTIYTGVTNDISRRIWEHKTKVYKGFSKKYDLDKLVYYEVYQDIESAITREKQLKDWKREWKLKLIDDFNVEWNDLYEKFQE